MIKIKGREGKLKEKRFITVYSWGNTFSGCKILADTATGVNYLYHYEGYGGGLTPLLDKDGKVTVTPADGVNEEGKDGKNN